MHLIPNTHTPGNHCSSTAIADLLRFHGFGWSESFCFGLGGGLGITYISSQNVPYERMIHTRSMDFEERFFKLIGLKDFKWQSSNSEIENEERLISAIKDNCPALILTDIYHLHYFNSKTHFPGHGVMVWGYDKRKQIFYVTDTERTNVEIVPFNAMRKARQSKMPPFIFHGNLFAPNKLTKHDDLGALCRTAIHENALRLLDSSNGIVALSKCQAELVDWSMDENWKWNCRFAYQIIEKRGTGGSGFRKMYSRFLEEAAEYVPKIKTFGLIEKMTESANAWYELSNAFKESSEQNSMNPKEISHCMTKVIEKETLYCKAALNISS